MLNVLIVDDSKAMRAILKRILESVGAIVEEAGNGREGLQKLMSGRPPDLVLVDWNMPHMSGLDFVRAVRADHAYRTLPLMMVTAETEKRQIGKALSEGANEYVMKPFTKEIIREKLHLLGIHLPQVT